MGWLARAPLVSAVANAGALGLIETSSGEIETIKHEIRAMAGLTDRPFGVNLPLMFLSRDDNIVDWLLDQGIDFVTTSAGDPARYIDRLKSAGMTVYHAVPSLAAAQKAAAAGVDGLIVEGGESAAFRAPNDIALFTLLQAVRAGTDLPIVAAGGIADGRGMAAAFALGAEGVQMGTRFVSAAESPAADAFKRAIVAAGEHATIVTNPGVGPCVRALRNSVTERIARGEESVAEALKRTTDLLLRGDMEAALAAAGQSAVLIDEILPASTIIERTITGFWRAIDRMAALGAGR